MMGGGVAEALIPGNAHSIATGGGVKTAWFKDTEGNTLAVSQRLSGVRACLGEHP